MKKILFPILLIGFLFCFSSIPAQQARVYNIVDFGAIGDGSAINTEAINKAVDECTSNGGGTVLVPRGKFVTGTILLKNNVTLYLENGSILFGSMDLGHYKSFRITSQDPEKPIGIRDNPIWLRCLILIDNCQNVTVTGTGTIDGNNLTDKQGEEGWRGPHGIIVGNSENVKITDVRIARAGNYNILGLNVNDIQMKNLTILEGSDGIHIRRGKDMSIVNCKIYTADDAIAGGYWENMLIDECMLNSSCNGIRMIFPATNMEIKNCEIFGPGVFGHRRGNPYITNTLTGIILQPGAWGRGPGNMEKVYIHDIRIRDTQTAMTFMLNEKNTGREIRVENVVATGIYKNACSVEAWPEESRFESISFKNIRISYNVDERTMKTKEFIRPRTESRALPYWGFYARNVDLIEMENVVLKYDGEEIRPVMGFDNVKDVVLKKVSYKTVPNIGQFKYSEGTKIKKTGCSGFQ